MAKRIVGIFIGISICLALYLFIFVKRPAKTLPDHLSSFAPDKYLKRANITDWPTSCLYIQFVSAKNLDSMRLCKSVLDNWSSEDIIIVILLNDDRSTRAFMDLPDQPNFSYVVNKSYNDEESTLADLGAYFIYDKHQKLIHSGTSSQGYDIYVKIYLLALLQNDRFQIADFAPINVNINDVPHLIGVKDIISGLDGRYFLVGLFNRFCGTCKTGLLIQALNELRSDPTKSFISISAILNSEYNDENDKESLISQSRISFPIYLSDRDLTRHWISLISRYNHLLLDDVILLIN